MSNKYKHNIHTEYSRALELKKAAFVISVVSFKYFVSSGSKKRSILTQLFFSSLASRLAIHCSTSQSQTKSITMYGKMKLIF